MWELVGQTFQAEGLSATGVEAEGTGDLLPAVYALGIDGLFVIRPGEETWTLIAARNEGGFRADDDIFVTQEGTLLANDFGRIQRSGDGGQTWTDVNDGGNVAPVYTPAGALLTGYDGHPTDTVTRSTDDGQTWEQIDMGPTLGGRTLPLAFAVLPPSDDLPAGRIVAGGNAGLVYSDDDGFSWQPTNVWTDFQYRASSVIRAPWGLLYAAVNDFAAGDVGGVWESADGAVWTRVGQIPAANDIGAQIVALGNSALYAINLSENEDTQVYASWDRGQTWVGTGQIDAEEEVGNPVRLREVVVGPEGRLWLGMTQGTGGPGLTGGVFRTVEPVFPVSAEGGPEDGPGKPGAELGAAYPNPSSGTVTIPVSLAEGAAVRIHVYDTVGRHVAVLHEGVLAAGEHRFGLDARTLPAGVYVVRAEVSDARSTTRAWTERVTVVR